MKRAMTLAVTASVTLWAGVAQAAEHQILMLGDAFFPSVTYADPGDTLRFVNVTESSQNVLAKNDKWALGPIAPNGEATIVIAPGVQSTFYNPDLVDSNGDMYVRGNFNFGEAPID